MSTANPKGWGGKKPTFNPRNPHKYLGDIDNIVYRSTWEHRAFVFCDNNANIIAWAAEEIIIPYMKPVFTRDGRVTTKLANYYPDLYVEYVDKQGVVVKELIEIKPKKQTRASKAKKYATNLYENIQYAVNTAKWAAADQYCKARGIRFTKITEDSLFN